jgi:hypothetical protein
VNVDKLTESAIIMLKDYQAISGIARPRTAVDTSEIEAVYVVFGLPWKAVGEAPGFRDAGRRGFGVDRAAWTGWGGR